MDFDQVIKHVATICQRLVQEGVDYNVAGYRYSVDHRRPHISPGNKNDDQKIFNFFKVKSLFIAIGNFDTETLDSIYGRL